MRSSPLSNHKHELFCHKYMETQNGTHSYKYAYPEASDASANSGGARLLREVSVQERISYLVDQRNKKTGLTSEWVIERLMKIADVDIKDVVSWTGEMVHLKDSADMSDKESYAIQEMSSRVRTESSDKGDMTTVDQKVKMEPKIKALELLGKHLGVFNDRIKIEHSSIEEIIKNAKKEDQDERE